MSNQVIGFGQLILACLSFLLNRIFRGGVTLVMLVRILMQKKQGESRWVGMSEMLSNKVMFLYVMLFAPRWNCGGNIAFLGPISVKSRILICWENNPNNRESWIIEVVKGREKIETIHSNQFEQKTSQYALEVNPGKYRLVYRGYGLQQDALYPQIYVDDGIALKTTSVGGEQISYNNLLQRLCAKEPVLYRALHYYTHYLMDINHPKFKHLLRKEYLPAANTETHFEYGGVRLGDKLSISVGDFLLENFYISLVCLNRASFPVHWEFIDRGNTILPDAYKHGSYLVRVVPKNSILDKNLVSRITSDLVVRVIE